MTESISNIGMDQADYMKIFMQELTYQDPLKPVDNKEFMAQMAQFSALQQARETSEGITKLLKMTAASQALSLLSKHVSFEGGAGKVASVVFDNSIPRLRINTKSSSEQVTISLQQITSING